MSIPNISLDTNKIAPYAITTTADTGSSACGSMWYIPAVSYTPAYKEEPMIGGAVCHLCGANKQYEYVSSDKVYKKKGCQIARSEYHKYRCGTEVRVDSTSKEGAVPVARDPEVFVGGKCIRFESAKLT